MKGCLSMLEPASSNFSIHKNLKGVPKSVLVINLSNSKSAFKTEK